MKNYEIPLRNLRNTYEKSAKKLRKPLKNLMSWVPFETNSLNLLALNIVV